MSSSILQIRWLDPLIPFLHYLTIEEQSRLLKCFFCFCSCKLCQHNAFAMKEQVNRAYKEESSDDEKREPLSEVSRFLHILPFCILPFQEDKNGSLADVVEHH